MNLILLLPFWNIITSKFMARCLLMPRTRPCLMLYTINSSRLHIPTTPQALGRFHNPKMNLILLLPFWKTISSKFITWCLAISNTHCYLVLYHINHSYSHNPTTLQALGRFHNPKMNLILLLPFSKIISSKFMARCLLMPHTRSSSILYTINCSHLQILTTP
jgi:hypothetical protein